ncbi:MAG: 5'/3'-nucleotidase SurE [Lachnospiraceae bacterium]|nr:5'/3'-nucleotidase SurE [Lachnospiraceae bacterium]
MRILITNDDSISSEVLLPLAKWTKQFGEVTVVVPKYEQSGKSHCIEIHKAFEVMEVPFDDPDIKAYTVDSSPADCVRYAIEGMHMEFDFVISGINRGVNLGIDMLYSGTVGAVFEAACFDIPAVALSTEPGGFDEAMAALDNIKDFFIKHDLMKKNSIYNVNIPIGSKGIRITRMGGRYYADDFLPQENHMFLPTGKSVWTDNGDYNIDTNAVLTGYTSILPLTLDRTNRKVFEELMKLNG